jgi:hypothetical protein
VEAEGRGQGNVRERSVVREWKAVTRLSGTVTACWRV